MADRPHPGYVSGASATEERLRALPSGPAPGAPAAAEAVSPQPEVLTSVLRLPIGQVRPGDNVRSADVGDVTELAASIRTVGILVPLQVVEDGPDRYRLIDGHRRYTAAQRVGLTHVPAIIRREAPAIVRIQQQLAFAGGKDLDPMAWADALHELMFGDANMSREEIARAVGRSPGFVRDRIALRQLTAAEQDQVRTGRMTVGAALLTIQGRRAERDGRPAPAPPVPALQRHCRTCSCHGRGTSR